MKSKRYLDRALAAVIACGLASPAWANRYRITDLEGDQWVTGINDVGAVTEGDGGAYARVYRHGTWHTLPGAPGGSQALAINDQGQVAGWAAVGSENDWTVQAVIWQRNMKKTVLQMPDPNWEGYPQAISDAGLVAGYSEDNIHTWRCVLWKPHEAGVDIGDDIHYCMARGVNDFGRVVGETQFADGGIRGFLWKAGRMQDLGALGGSSSSAYAINWRGQVVGTAQTAAGNERHAFLWQDGKMTDIGHSQVFDFSGARALNARGEIVGEAVISATGDEQAVRFEGGQIVRLADEVENLDDWTLVAAVGINDKGVIIGGGNRPGDNRMHFFKLTPVD